MTGTTMRRALAAAIGMLGLAVAVGGGAGLADASTGPAVSGTEHFQFMTTSATSSTASAIARGVFVGGGVIRRTNSNPSTVVLNGGTFKVRHSKGHGPQKFNPRTCLFTVNQRGTYRISHGTGRFAGISGHGTYHVTILGVGARSHGKCSQKFKPIAYQQVISASGPVHL
jgi:hypothetical protein